MFEAALVILGLAAEAGPSVAPRAPTFALAYEGGSDCPTRSSFEAAILARAPNARRAEAGEEPDVTFEAMASAPPGQKQRLRVLSRDGTSQDREIDADDCAEAVQSMAVIAAMILESRPAEPPKAPPKPEVTPTAAPLEKPAPRQAMPPPRRASRPTWFALGAGFGLEGAVAPSPAFTASPFAELGSVTTSALAPSLRLSLLLGQAADVSTAAGDARFRLLSSRLHLCGLRLGAASEAHVRLCAAIDAGALLAQGIDTLNERSQNMLWLGAGLGAIGSLPLNERWAVKLCGGGRALLVHDEFVFAPHVPAHQVPVIAWDFSAALAFKVW